MKGRLGHKIQCLSNLGTDNGKMTASHVDYNLNTNKTQDMRLVWNIATCATHELNIIQHNTTVSRFGS